VKLLKLKKEDLAKFIDHTNLRPDSTWDSIEKTIDEALKFGFRGVCIPPYWVKKAREKLGKNSKVKLVTVVGFPLGYVPTSIKVKEIEEYIDAGADELDIVINISEVKAHNWDSIRTEMEQLLKASKGHLIKVIIGTDYLTEEEIAEVSRILSETGIPVIKTNTGFGKRGVTEEDVKIIKRSINEKTLIKAAGGIRTALDAIKLIKAGANIIGTSSGVKILETFDEKILREV